MKVLDYPKDKILVERLFRRKGDADPETERQVRAIIERVRRQGDRAVAELTKRLDKVDVIPSQFHITTSRLKKAWNGLSPNLRQALELANDRIEAYHKRQMISGFTYRDSLGIRMDQRVQPLRRVGVYVPGGSASYPSTVLMDIVPAKLAGVDQVVLLTPPGLLDQAGGQAALGAAWLAGVDEALAVSGTAGLAALALGTESIDRVDKIVGPGNRYVAMAKRLLYGEIDIDMIAGPSEVLILADSTAAPKMIAADLLSQAEHDPDAQAIVILIGEYPVEKLQAEVLRQKVASPRREIIRKSLRSHGAILRVKKIEHAIDLANAKAPEHLEILTKDARKVADRVRNAGAIFLGPWTPEALGDYAAGPNHTLPTGGTARFFSPLSVWSFLKTSHVVECSQHGFKELADTVETLASTEGLFAHAESVRCRR